MVLFWPVQQELDCINYSGRILGKIKFGRSVDEYIFYPYSESLILSSAEKTAIDDRLSGLRSGKYLIPMQDDD